MSTKIPWTEQTWNPVVGCTKVSSGCKNCYAERMAGRLANMRQVKYMTVAEMESHKPSFKQKWNGHIFCDESALDKPLHWKKPRKIFVCSMGDLFHESVSFEFIDRVIEVTEVTPWHVYQILTKRPERMREYFKWRWNTADQHKLDCTKAKQWKSEHGVDGLGKVPANLWLGTTCENQEMADKRIPQLLQIPAAVRFVSIEPMLGAVDLERLESHRTWPFKAETEKINTLYGYGCSAKSSDPSGAKFCDRSYGKIDWVIIGCESGPKRRPCPVEWVRGLTKQCKAAGVPAFVKQLARNGKVSKNPAEWPKDLRIQDYPNETQTKRVQD